MAKKFGKFVLFTAAFFDLKKEKQDRMINAALKAFALGGYRHASTDDIVKDAAPSAGRLPHRPPQSPRASPHLPAALRSYQQGAAVPLFREQAGLVYFYL